MTFALWRFALRGSVLAWCALAAAYASASGLQVAPTTLSLKPTQNADGIWLNNTGDNVVHVQVRVYHWTQNDQGDQLTTSRGLIISPPMLQLDPGAHQLIRVIRVGAPPHGDGAVEDAYRLAIDELPVAMHSQQGLQFVLHYSVPIFVEPVGAPAKPPQLEWHMLPDSGGATLQVTNHGGTNAQLAALNFIDSSGHRSAITPGLLGYVLPGNTMHWTLQLPGAAVAMGGTLEALINGQNVKQILPSVDHAR